MIDSFVTLRDFVDELNKTTSTLDKVKVLEKYKNDEFIKKILYYTYNQFFQYGVSSKNLKKLSHLQTFDKKYESIFELLDDLRLRKITGHNAISAINQFVYKFENYTYSELVYNIFDRSLKTRADEKLINRVFENLIPTFSVALAENFKDRSDKIDFETEKWYASTKIDGCRCITIIDEVGNINFFSRSGKEFTTLANLVEDIKALNLKNAVIDGEVCIIDEKTGIENFNGIMSEIRRKDYTIKNPGYMVFDLICKLSFEYGFSSYQFEQRLKELTKLKFPARIKILKQTLIKDKQHYLDLFAEAMRNKREGLILRRADSVYEGKRTKTMLKCKEFFDAEFKVVRAEMGPIRYVKENKEVTEEMLSAVVILYKGNEVSVGSGFELEERQFYYKYPEAIIGETVTVCYFSESEDKSGKKSLRFPTFKCVHGSKREI